MYQLIENRDFFDGKGLSLLLDPSDSGVIIRNCNFFGMRGDVEDGLTLAGGDAVSCRNKVYFVERCVFTQKTQSPTQSDELASIIYGARANFYQCRFEFNGKGVLVGNGDTDELDLTSVKCSFVECIFEGCSRRNPFAQVGQTTVRNCVVKNWGIDDTFHEKSFGIRVGSKGQAIVQNTVFLQEDLITCLKRKNVIKDTFNHYVFPMLGPGFRRAAYADKGGQIACYNCYTNRPWLYVQNHIGPRMNEGSAIQFANMLDRCVPKVVLKQS